MWAGNEEGSTVLGVWEQSWLPQQWDVCVGSSGQVTVQMGRHQSVTKSWECHTSLAVGPETTKKPREGPLHIHC